MLQSREEVMHELGGQSPPRMGCPRAAAVCPEPPDVLQAGPGASQGGAGSRPHLHVELAPIGRQLAPGRAVLRHAPEVDQDLANLHGEHRNISVTKGIVLACWPRYDGFCYQGQPGNIASCGRQTATSKRCRQAPATSHPSVRQPFRAGPWPSAPAAAWQTSRRTGCAGR